MSILSESRHQLVWIFILLLALIYTSIEVSLYFSLSLENSFLSVGADLFLSALFAADIYLNLKYFPKLESGETYKTPLGEYYQQERPSYQKVIDILAIIPFSLLGHIIPGAEFLCFLQVTRLLKLIQIIKVLSFLRSMGAFPKWIMGSLGIIGGLVVIHWIACGWMWIYPNTGSDDLYTFYNKALYWSLTTLTTIGYGDITPDSNIGRIYTMVIMLLGVGVYGVVIGNVSKILVAADRYKVESKQKLEDLALFMRHYKIPVFLQRQIYNFYHHLTQKRLTDNDTNIIAELPHALQNEIQIYMNMKLISGVPVFQNMSVSCMRMLSASLEQMYFSPNEFIIRRGEMGNEMFILGHGAVDIMNAENATIATLKQGQCFGEMALLESKTRSHNVKASDYCDIYRLDKENFLKVIEKHPKLKSNFDELIKKRRNTRK